MNSLIISTIILLALLAATALASLYFQRREKVRLLEEIERLRDEKNASDAARTEAETEIRRRMDEHARTTAELAAVKAATETELAALRRKTEEQRETEQQERKKPRRPCACNSVTWQMRFSENSRNASAKPTKTRWICY